MRRARECRGDHGWERRAGGLCGFRASNVFDVWRGGGEPGVAMRQTVGSLRCRRTAVRVVRRGEENGRTETCS